MATARLQTRIYQVAACLSLAAPALATPQWWNGGSGGAYGPNGGYGGAYGGGYGAPGNGDNGFGSGGFGLDNSGFPNGFNGALGFNLDQALHYRYIHGILAALAFVILFPIGSILIRVVPGRFALFAHALTQIIALLIFIAAAGLGIYLVATVRIPFQNGNYSLLNDTSVNFHPIIGIIVLIMVLIQPVFGYLHHAAYKRLKRRQAWSHLHIWNGRIAITLGIINGGLGLMASRASGAAKTAYAVVAAIMWVLWFCAAVFGECRRAMAARRESRQRRKEARRRERVHKSSVRSTSG